MAVHAASGYCWINALHPQLPLTGRLPRMQICITTMAIVAAYLLAQYAIPHTFTIATVGCVAVGAFITACVWLTVHDQVSPGSGGPAQPNMGTCAVQSGHGHMRVHVCCQDAHCSG